jgi:diguanylate cyclase (GGDEF)-like protein
MSRGRGLVSLAFLLVAILAAAGVQLHDAQRENRRAAELRFEQRAKISAAITQSVVGALGSASADELARRFGEGPAGLRGRLAWLAARGNLGYVAILDERGDVVARTGTAQPPRGADGAGSVLSDVRGTAAGPLIDYRLAFATRGAKRVLLQGIPVALMRSLLEDYLGRLPNHDGALFVVLDRAGTELAVVAPQGATVPAHDALTTTVEVPGTTWRLRMQADRDGVLAGSGRGIWLGWALLGGLSLAIVAGLWLYACLIGAARRTTAAAGGLRESERKLRALLGALDEAVFLQHADGRVELLNASAKALAQTDADIVMEPPAHWFSEEGAPIAAADTPAGRSLAGGTPERRVIGLECPGQERRWLDVSTRALMRSGSTTPYAVVCSCTDVTERQNLETHLLALADRDPLTGLWNRRRFELDLAHQLDRCRRYGERAALVVMDVDGFKQVNDVLGHLAGDEVLCAIGDALSTRLRSSDRAARLGGDEFAVLLLNVDEDEGTRISGELVGEMCAGAYGAQDRIPLSISVGTAQLEHTSGGVNQVLEAAELAMQATKEGRDGPPAGAHALRPAVAATAEIASLRALLAAVNARDSYTAMHSREVVMLARGVARRLGLGETLTSEVEHIALLHDLGKIAVPDAILRKAGPLTSSEQTLMRQHPVVGAEILASMPELAHLAAGVRAEHERWDGGGYPDGLAGQEIPIASRIALVCDAYHAMTSHRPYRRAMSAAAARDEISREAGAQFCPHAAAALLEVLLAARARGSLDDELALRLDG